MSEDKKNNKATIIGNGYCCPERVAYDFYVGLSDPLYKHVHISNSLQKEDGVKFLSKKEYLKLHQRLFLLIRAAVVEGKELDVTTVFPDVVGKP